MSLNIGHGRNHVDAATSDDHGGLARESGGSGLVNLVAGNGVNGLAVLPEGEGSVSLIVASNLLESIT